VTVNSTRKTSTYTVQHNRQSWVW